MDFNAEVQNQNEGVNTVVKGNKCVSCGADLIFDGKTNTLYCEHCESRYNVQNEVFSQKKIFNPSELSNENIKTQVVVARCSNCGASESLNSSSISHICPFCGSPKITSNTNLSYSPDAIVPFSIEKKDLPSIFKKWVKKRKFVPNAFKKIDCIESIKPIYAPCWLFDAKANTSYDGVLMFNKVIYVTNKEGKRERKVITEYKNVSGNRKDIFNNMTVYAGESLLKQSFQKIEPFDLTNIKVYSDEYLAGYYTNQYAVDLKESWLQTNRNIEGMIRDNIVDDYNADGYSRLKIVPKFEYTKYAYTFLPIWLGNYIYNSKNYNIYINGTNGKITGKSPLSKVKLGFFIAFLVILVGIVAYFMIKTQNQVAG